MTNIRRNLEGMPFRYGGRTFSEAEIETIRTITDDPWCTTQTDIAGAVCAALQWVTPAGQPKLDTCRKALQQMEADGASHAVARGPGPPSADHRVPGRFVGSPARAGAARQCRGEIVDRPDGALPSAPQCPHGRGPTACRADGAVGRRPCAPMGSGKCLGVARGAHGLSPTPAAPARARGRFCPCLDDAVRSDP